MADTTARDIIQDGLESLGVYAAGETMSAADADRSLTILNNMIDSWSNESLSCYTILEQNDTMVVGQFQYTIGAGGNFNMTRPLRILDGPGTAYLQDTQGNKYPVQVVPRDQWNLVTNPTQVTSNVPDKLFYDPQYPLGVINVFPIPNISWVLYWDSYLQLVEFSDLFADISLPPGYTKALVDNFAVEAARYFKPDGWQPPALLIRSAAQAKANIKRTNMRSNVAVYDREIVARGTGSYNIYSDRNY